MRPRLVLLAAGACLLIGESGCAWLHGLVSAPRQAPQPPRTASAVSSDLELIGRLAGESPARQAAQLAKAKTETPPIDCATRCCSQPRDTAARTPSPPSDSFPKSSPAPTL